MSHKIRLAVVTAVRNISATTLERSMLSTYKHGKRILIDYGSTQKFSKIYTYLCNKYSYEYHYVLGKGEWNRANAVNHILNIYSPNSIDVLTIADGDIILGFNTQLIANEFSKDPSFFIFHPMYAVDQIDIQQDSKKDIVYIKSNGKKYKYLINQLNSDTLTMLCDKLCYRKWDEEVRDFANVTVNYQWFYAVKGYDSTYHVWGGEDRDLAYQAYIDHLRLEPKWKVFHQKHPRREKNIKRWSYWDKRNWQRLMNKVNERKFKPSGWAGGKSRTPRDIIKRIISI